MRAMNTALLEKQIKAAQVQLDAAIAAQTAIITDGLFSYTMDTGQGKTTVTKHTVGQLDALIDSLMNRIAVLEARLCGNNAFFARPGF